MLFTVKKENIIEGLQKAAGIIPTRAGAAYLRSLWIKAEGEVLTIMATDANIEFTGTYPADVKEPGLVGVNGRNFVDLVRRLPAGELRIRLDDATGTVILEQGRRTYKPPANDPTWFQSLAPFSSEGAVVWSGDFFQEIIDRVFFCVSDDESSDAIACLYFKPVGEGHIEVCGLNGHQFALVSFTHDDLAARLPEEGVLIQKKYLQDMKKWLGVDEIELNITDKRLYLLTLDGAESLSVPRAGHDYPDYTVFMSRLEGDGVSLLTVNRKEAIEALGRIQIFNTDSDRCAYLDLGDNEVRLSAQGQDTGSANESLEVTYRGDISRIAFPTRNLMDVLGHFSSPSVDMILTGAEGPCGIRGSEDNEYTVIIMPMKISESTYYSEEDV